MKLRASGIAWLLPLLLTACFHKTHQQQVQATAPPVESAPVQTSPEVQESVAVKPTPSQTVAPASQITTPKTKAPVKHTQSVKRNPGQAANSTSKASGDPRPIASAIIGVSAIGQLTSNDSFELQKQTVDAITAVEQGLNRIDRKLNEQEQKTSAQIRGYLKQAKAALSTGDVDGAHTLTAKAKLLLDELSH
ncbi:MAG TPA: hypothetical protein VGF01_18350 [Terracidiphilus sp.]|jgi:hypothetical protein